MHNCIRKMPWTARELGCLLCCAILMGSSGCGHDGRVSLEGTVTLDGRPMQKGYIRFSPLPGSTGPTAGADILEGKFVVLPSGGPFAGHFQVQITAAESTGRKIRDPRSGAMIDEYTQYLPARYNRQSELQAEVTASGPNQFDFALASQKGSHARK